MPVGSRESVCLFFGVKQGRPAWTAKLQQERAFGERKLALVLF